MSHTRHTIKLWTRTIDSRIEVNNSISRSQFGVMPAKFTMEPIFIVSKKLIEKRQEHIEGHVWFS